MSILGGCLCLWSISSSHTRRAIATHPRGDENGSVCGQYYMEPRLQAEKVQSEVGHHQIQTAGDPHRGQQDLAVGTSGSCMLCSLVQKHQPWRVSCSKDHTAWRGGLWASTVKSVYWPNTQIRGNEDFLSPLKNMNLSKGQKISGQKQQGLGKLAWRVTLKGRTNSFSHDQDKKTIHIKLSWI